MIVNCDICNKEIKLPHWRIRKSKTNNFFCSKLCKRTNCLICDKKIDHSKRTQSKKLCNDCYVKDYFDKYPSKLSEQQKKNREKQRIKYGIPIDAPLQRVPKGSGTKDNDGYRRIIIKNHPNADKKGRVWEHHVIMSVHLGRPIKKEETIHHKNGIRDDNRIENLELWHKQHPPGQRVEEKIKYYIEFLNEYGYDVIKRGL